MEYLRNNLLKHLKENLLRNHHLLQILMGPRQVGKTTLVHQLIQTWQDPSSYVTADQLTPPDVLWIQVQWEKARQLVGRCPLLVIDEVQKIPRWSEIVKKLHDEDVWEKRPLRVLLLGSSALLLEKGLTESLAGRFALTRCTHWGYRECREAFGWSLNQFLYFGGYPGGAAEADDDGRWRDYIQNAILETVIGRDIPMMRRIEHPALFRQTLAIACRHPAEILSYQKMLGQLQDKGSVNTIADYIDLLASAFLVKPIQKWSEHEIRVRGSIPKLVVQNNGLINALRGIPFEEAMADLDFRGRLIENAVGAFLVNQGHEVYYWRERGWEVDFVVRSHERLYAIEVKSGRARHPASLKIFKDRYPSAEVLVVAAERSNTLLEDFLQKGLA